MLVLRTLAVSLAIAMLAGCSCCNERGQVRTYFVDDATAMGIGPYNCEDLCDALGSGTAEADVPDAGSRPIAPATSCDISHGPTAWRPTCVFGHGCPS